MPRDSTADRLVCPDTGLALVASTGQQVYRIAKTSYGPINPPKREQVEALRTWGRFDVPGQQVLYAGSPKEAAYAESLASLRPADDIRNTFLEELFDDEADSSATLYEAVEAEWDAQFRWVPGKVSAQWRDDRAQYALTLPTNGWFIDIGHSASVAVIEAALGNTLRATRGPLGSINQGHLFGSDRPLTTEISTWLWGQVLWDGHLPHGVIYQSKHGADMRCYAVYLRALGDGKDTSSEPTKLVDGTDILDRHHNPALDRVMTLFGLTGH